MNGLLPTEVVSRIRLRILWDIGYQKQSFDECAKEEKQKFSKEDRGWGNLDDTRILGNIVCIGSNVRGR